MVFHGGEQGRNIPAQVTCPTCCFVGTHLFQLIRSSPNYGSAPFHS